jgi:hypothetical protein
MNRFSIRAEGCRYTARRPVIRRTSTMMTANTSSRCIKGPTTCVTNPRTHSTNKIAIIVQSIEASVIVSHYVGLIAEPSSNFLNNHTMTCETLTDRNSGECNVRK